MLLYHSEMLYGKFCVIKNECPIKSIWMAYVDNIALVYADFPLMAEL